MYTYTYIYIYIHIYVYIHTCIHICPPFRTTTARASKHPPGRGAGPRRRARSWRPACRPGRRKPVHTVTTTTTTTTTTICNSSTITFTITVTITITIITEENLFIPAYMASYDSTESSHDAAARESSNYAPMNPTSTMVHTIMAPAPSSRIDSIVSWRRRL